MSNTIYISSTEEDEEDICITNVTFKSEVKEEDGVDLCITNATLKSEVTDDSIDEIGYESPFEEEIKYYNDDRLIPILRQGKGEVFSTQAVVDLLIQKKSTRIASKRPIKVQQNLTFIINLSKLKSRNDWAADDNGSWENRGNAGTIVELDENLVVVESRRMPRERKNRPKLLANECLLLKTYYRNKSSRDFRRNSTIIQTHDGKTLDLLLLEYWYENDVHPIVIRPHGLAKKSKRPHIPTAASTKETIRKAVNGTVRGPTTLYDKVFESVGGIDNFTSRSDIPRNPQQIKRARNLIRQPKSADTLTELHTFSASNPQLVFNVQFSPHTKFVVASKATLDHLEEMCTLPGDLLTVLQIDKTFNVGDFFVTPTCYQYGKVQKQSDGKRPWIPGPALFHTKEDQSVHRYLAQTIVQENPEMKKILFIGMDREKAIENGLATELPYVTFLYCRKHMEDDIDMKLKSLKLDALVKKSIITDIFGNDHSQVKGLIDCEDGADLYPRMENMYKRWSELTGGTEFGEYFKTYILKDFADGMLASVRRAAGLGENFLYTNAVESTHSKYKRRIWQVKSDQEKCGKPSLKCSWTEAARIYIDMVAEHFRNLERAIIGEGTYELVPEYSNLLIDHTTWKQMSKAEKDKKKARFCGRFPDLNPKTCENNIAHSSPNTVQNNIAIDATSYDLDTSNSARSSNTTLDGNSSSVCLPDEECQPSGSGLHRYQIETSSDEDVTNENEVTNPTTFRPPEFPQFHETGLPGNLAVDWNGARLYLQNFFIYVEKLQMLTDSFMVKSRSDANSVHLVQVKDRDVFCPCQRNKTTQGICAHSITIAYHLDLLETHLVRWAPTIEHTLNEIQPVNTGKKKSAPKRRKRTKTADRNTETYQDKRPAKLTIEDNEKFHLVYVDQTRSYKCYGCKKKYRKSETAPPPPAPHDMVLGIKMHRVFSMPGSTQLRVTTDKENTYFHLKRKCFKEEFPHRELTLEDLVVNHVVSPPKLVHKLKIKDEFRLIIN